MSIDIGTGTGQAVLRRARLNPNELVIGVDADALAMADASRRAAARPLRGGLSNALFLAAAAEHLPGPLARTADHVTIALPWGSLLRALLTPDMDLIHRLSALLRATGELEILVSATGRDAAAANITLKSGADAVRLAVPFESAGLQVVECRLATESDINRLSSRWGRRLGIPARRQAWLFRARKVQAVCSTPSAMAAISAGSRPL